MKIPSLLLTWLSAVMVWLTFEMSPELLGKVVTMLTSLATLGAAVLTYFKQKRNERQSIQNRTRIEQLEELNAALIQEVMEGKKDSLQFKSERAAFRSEVRDELQAMKKDE